MAKKERSIDHVTAISKQLADDMRLELVETAFEKEPAGIYLRIYLDKPGGISLDDCENYHRAVQPLVANEEYDFLEVCSPGIDRPIKTDRDVKKALGSEVEIRLYKPRDGQKEFKGVLLSFDEAGYHVRMSDREMLFPVRDVALARRFVDLGILEKGIPASQEGKE